MLEFTGDAVMFHEEHVVHHSKSRHFIDTVISSDKASLNLDTTLLWSWEETVERGVGSQKSTLEGTKGSSSLGVGAVDLRTVNEGCVGINLFSGSSR